MTYQVVEKFVSINGEGTKAGKLAVFIRFKGCNLSCSYCDTCWANEEDAVYVDMTSTQIQQYIIETGVRHVTLTGGEPLLQNGIRELLESLANIEGIQVEIETNGSVEIQSYAHLPVSFTLDYKLPGSGMESEMNTRNYNYIRKFDTVKFVCSSTADLDKAREIVNEHKLGEKCSVYLSPVFGRIAPEDMVTYMIKHQMNDCTLQLQMHKFIWDPNAKGV